jgi:hypothetical protein
MTQLPSFQAFADSARWVALIVVAAVVVGLVIVALRKALGPTPRKSASEPPSPGEKEAPPPNAKEALFRKPGRRFGPRISSSRQGLPAWMLPMRRKKAGVRLRRERRQAVVHEGRPVGRWIVLFCGVAIPVGLFLASLAIGPSPDASVPAPRLFRASFAGPSVQGAPKSYVNATVGQQVWMKVELDPGSEPFLDPQIDVEGPGAIVFQVCSSHIEGEDHPGYVDGPDTHLEPGDLASGVAAQVDCEFSVERRVFKQEPIQITLSGTNREGMETRQLFLEPSGGKSGREAAEAMVASELRHSPAAWSRSSFTRRKKALIQIGREWPLFSPYSLHGLGSLPRGRKTSLTHLWSDRSQPKGLIQFKAVIAGPVIAVATFNVGDDNLRSKRWIFPLGLMPGGTLAWCAVTRSTSQPKFSEGQRLEVKAAVLGYAISEASRGSAAMLDCAAVRRIGGPRARKSEIVPGGATTAPAGSGR